MFGLSILGWGGFQSLMVRNEELVCDHSGNFLISSYDYSVRGTVYRNLDGSKPKEANPIYVGVDLFGRRGVDYRSAEDSFWDARLVAITDAPPGRNAATWFGVLDRNHRLYFEGFDQGSQLSVGYLGRKGYRKTIPPREEWFTLRNGSVNRQGIWVTPSGRVIRSVSELDTVEHGAYLLDEGSLYEIDFAERSVRTVLKNSPAHSVLAASYFDAREPAEGKRTAADVALLRSRLLLRSNNELSLVNPKTGEVTSFPIPNDMREEEPLKVFLISDQKLAVTTRGEIREGLRKFELRTISTTGEVTETLPVELAARDYTPNPRVQAWGMLPFMPIPLLWTLSQGEYSILQHLAYVWPPLLLLLLISLLAAFWVYRSERHHYGAHPLAWSITTFLLGPAMLVAYLIERGRPVTTTCGECHAQVPAKRDACAKCGAEFPAPERTGCEIFAT
jgi:hypothetical protein